VSVLSPQPSSSKSLSLLSSVLSLCLLRSILNISHLKVCPQSVSNTKLFLSVSASVFLRSVFVLSVFLISVSGLSFPPLSVCPQSSSSQCLSSVFLRSVFVLSVFLISVSVLSFPPLSVFPQSSASQCLSSFFLLSVFVLSLLRRCILNAVGYSMSKGLSSIHFLTVLCPSTLLFLPVPVLNFLLSGLQCLTFLIK
jgi:hypothetical protein